MEMWANRLHEIFGTIYSFIEDVGTWLSCYSVRSSTWPGPSISTDPQIYEVLGLLLSMHSLSRKEVEYGEINILCERCPIEWMV